MVDEGDTNNPLLVGVKSTSFGDGSSISNRISSDPGTNIFSDESEQQKTFGLQYLVDGVSEAFYPKSQLNGINKISINIRK